MEIWLELRGSITGEEIKRFAEEHGIVLHASSRGFWTDVPDDEALGRIFDDPRVNVIRVSH